MFSKVKCPTCNAENSKERMTCVECGASLTFGQAESQVNEEPMEAKVGLAGLKAEFQILKDAFSEERIPRDYSDRRIDKLCADLRVIGLDAHIAERGQPEEGVSLGASVGVTLGLIEILDSPIRWVTVFKAKYGGSDVGNPTFQYTNAYLVPDSTMQREAYIRTIRKKSLPIIGRVVDLHWLGNFKEGMEFFMLEESIRNQSLVRLREAMRRLNEDEQLNQNLLKAKEDIEIGSDPKYDCWIIRSKWYQKTKDERYNYDKQPAPSRELWNYYETIARHLSEPVESKET